MAHLSHWMEHDINCLEAIKEGREPVWESDIEMFNAQGVTKRSGCSWEEIYQEFIEKGNRLIELYETFPNNLWHRKFWQDNEETPAKFLQEDINHWKNEHLPQLENYPVR